MARDGLVWGMLIAGRVGFDTLGFLGVLWLLVLVQLWFELVCGVPLEIVCFVVGFADDVSQFAILEKDLLCF